MKACLLAVTLAGASISTYATTWFPGEETDPISGEITAVQSIGSYGSYVYQWDSKYDAIYWPLTEESYLRFNTNSGYIALGGDFEDISTNEIAAVKAFLSANYEAQNAPQSHMEKLQWLERVYAHRETSEIFFIRHYCLLSYLNRNDETVAAEYRKTALQNIEPYLKTAEPSFYRSQLYIVAGFYSQLLGNDAAAEAYWSAPERLIVDEETTDDAKEYLEGILSSIKSGEYKERYFSK